MQPKILLLIFLFSLLFFGSFAQQKSQQRLISKTSYYQQLNLNSKSRTDTISSSKDITSLALSVGRSSSFENSRIIAGKDTFNVVQDLHDDDEGSVKYSQLIIFNEPVFSFFFVHEENQSEFSFHLIHSGKSPTINTRKNSRTAESCSKPSSINQSEWRAGLPAPSYSPAYSTPKHLIVHHSAGSNNNTDYTNVVRQIYLYHTEVRQYSDIAYNFLIAQNGTIYEGREATGENEENVVGAHFCAKNTGTMGVCLLGNYETASPAPAMLTSLEKILGWKLSKDKLNPFDFTPHPAGSLTPLGVIAGHRDGCETECPGKNVYDLLSVIKQKSNEVKSRYDTETPVPELVSLVQKLNGQVTITVSGGSNGDYLWFTSDLQEDSIPGAHSSVFTTPVLTEPATYFVALKHADCVSPLLPIEITASEEQLVVHPNPTDGDITISTSSSFLPQEIRITNNLGQLISKIKPIFQQNKFTVNTSNLTSGLYVFEFKNPQKTVKRRIVVR